MKKNLKPFALAISALIVCLVLTASTSAFAQKSSHRKTVAPPPPLLLGTAWYPEQWPESRWPADLELMQKAGIHVVRVGEFAWSTMEPSEGDYHFGWLERAINEAGQHGIYTVIGTPTAAPPAWLTQKYPETLRTEQDGRKAEHGNRQQFNWDNQKYRELCRDIASRMAKRFAHNPYVIGWQIDNEYAEVSFDPQTRADFQAWLKNYYGTLDNLNARWTTAYWSQTYSNWDQIPIETTGGNPGLLLSWKRFVSDTWRGYQKNQLDAIRQYAAPRQFITTNMMGWFDGYDHYVVTKDLDLAAWDDYVGEGQLNQYQNGSTDDLTRGFKRKNFWIMETQPGHVNWHLINNDLNKGEVRAMAWENVGHGADAVSYWQWRSDLNGQEEYHGTLIGPDGTPLPLYPEVAQIGREFMKAGPVLAGTSPKSQVAILHTYPSFWAINWQRHNNLYDPIAELLGYYQPLKDIAQSIDIVQPTVSLSQYKLVVAPGLNVLTQAAAKNLIAYVRNGGHLILGQRTGMKNSDNGLQTERQPGPLVPLLGGRVEAYYALLHPVPVSGKFGDNTSQLWAELLSTGSPDTQVLETYGKSNGWLDGKPAIITRKVGKGSITYVGVWMDEAGMARLAKWMTAMSGVQPAFGPVPAGMEVDARYGKGHAVFVLINLSEGPQTVHLPVAMDDVLNGGSIESVSLPRYGVSVLSRAMQ
ncbi:MAG: beta-galactosidase [Acidobacteriaceae bacterium]